MGLFIQSRYKTTRILIEDKIAGITLDYSPENQIYIGPGFTYKFIGNGLSFNLGLFNDDGDEPVNRVDIFVNLMLKKIVFDFTFRFYKNFTLKNPDDLNLPADVSNYVRPDIRTMQLGIGGVYVLNHRKFSYRAAFTQTAIQKKSAGSFMFGAQVFLRGLLADSSIFPSTLGFPEVTGNSSLYVGLTASYAYNFIIKRYYFLALNLASSVEFGKAVTILDQGQTYSNHYPVLSIKPRLVAGINKPRWYLGIAANKDYFVQLVRPDDDRYTFLFRAGSFRIFYGHRFNWFSRRQIRD